MRIKNIYYLLNIFFKNVRTSEFNKKSKLEFLLCKPKKYNSKNNINPSDKKNWLNQFLKNQELISFSNQKNIVKNTDLIVSNSDKANKNNSLQKIFNYEELMKEFESIFKKEKISESYGNILNKVEVILKTPGDAKNRYLTNNQFFVKNFNIYVKNILKDYVDTNFVKSNKVKLFSPFLLYMLINKQAFNFSERRYIRNEIEYISETILFHFIFNFCSEMYKKETIFANPKIEDTKKFWDLHSFNLASNECNLFIDFFKFVNNPFELLIESLLGKSKNTLFCQIKNFYTKKNENNIISDEITYCNFLFFSLGCFFLKECNLKEYISKNTEIDPNNFDEDNIILNFRPKEFTK